MECIMPLNMSEREAKTEKESGITKTIVRPVLDRKDAIVPKGESIRVVADVIIRRDENGNVHYDPV
jgi:hypothetical protein